MEMSVLELLIEAGSIGTRRPMSVRMVKWEPVSMIISLSTFKELSSVTRSSSRGNALVYKKMLRSLSWTINDDVFG